MSSKGVMRMPWRAKIFQSYFMFWPILRIGGVLQHRLQRGQRLVQRQLALGQGGRAEKVAAAGGVAERDVGRPCPRRRRARCRRGRPHLVKAGGFGVDGDMADVADPGDPAVQRGRVADAFVGGMVEGQLRASCGLRRRLPATCRREFRAWPGRRPQLVGDALGQGAELHRRQEIHDRVGFGQSGFPDRPASRPAACRSQRAPACARCGSGRRCRPAPRGAWAA